MASDAAARVIRAIEMAFDDYTSELERASGFDVTELDARVRDYLVDVAGHVIIDHLELTPVAGTLNTSLVSEIEWDCHMRHIEWGSVTDEHRWGILSLPGDLLDAVGVSEGDAEVNPFAASARELAARAVELDDDPTNPFTIAARELAA